jgi:DNA-binding SARP family transcriptional activator
LSAAPPYSRSRQDCKKECQSLGANNAPKFFHRNGRADGDPALLVCVLGSFRLLGSGKPVQIGSGIKAELLLTQLALGGETGVRRQTVLRTLWPNSTHDLANCSLCTLLYSLRKLVGAHLGGAPTVVRTSDRLVLNYDAGVRVDTQFFEGFVRDGQNWEDGGQYRAARESYERAMSVYIGPLCVGGDPDWLIESERLQGLYLTLLTRMADMEFREGDYAACLKFAQRILASDPCREDAHRIAMRALVRRGDRAGALRQYRLCERALRLEFDVAPEPATADLFESLRVSPESV